jgi:Fe2+ or Zn2+ uptake regulation protein
MIAASSSPERLLHEHGLRVTASRIAILVEMQKQPRRFFRPEDILRAWLANDQPGRISSAYRVLAELAQGGLLHRACNQAGQAVYRLATGQPALNRIRLTLPDGRALWIDNAVLRSYIDQLALGLDADIADLNLELKAKAADIGNRESVNPSVERKNPPQIK